MDRGELGVDGREPGLDGIEATVDGREATVDGFEATVDRLEATVDRLEALVLGRESGVHFGESSMDLRKPAINQLCMLAKVLFKRLAAHKCLDECHAQVERCVCHASRICGKHATTTVASSSSQKQ